MFKFELGEILKDTITGLAGVVMVRAQYLTGCTHYGLLQRTLGPDGKEIQWEWIDEKRLERIKGKREQVIKNPFSTERAGGGPAPVGPRM